MTNISHIIQANNTNATRGVGDDDQVAVILTVISKLVCALILFVGIFGNSLVLIVFGSRWSRLKACEIFMISLAFADLIGTIVTPTLQLFETMGGDFKPIRDVGCKLIHFSIITSVTVSSLTLIAITFDRFVIVKWPLRERVSFRTLRYVVLLTWMLGSGPGIVYLVGGVVKLHHEPHTDVYVCRMFLKPNEEKLHTLITFCVQVVIPLVLMILLYSLITYELWKTTKTRQFQMREREMRARYQRNKKAIKLLIAIVVTFFVCIAPVNTFYILYLFQAHNLPIRETIRLFTIMQMLQMINSCINPIIYSKLHTSFRRTTLRIFCSCCFEKVRNYQWEDFGETFKSVMTSSIRFASMRLAKANLPFIKSPVPTTDSPMRTCQNGNPYCKKDGVHRHCHRNVSPDRGSEVTTASHLPSISPSPGEGVCKTRHKYRRAGGAAIPRSFSLTRGKEYMKDYNAPLPPSYSEYIKMQEMKNLYPRYSNEDGFVSTSIFPKHHSVKFDRQPLIPGNEPVAI